MLKNHSSRPVPGRLELYLPNPLFRILSPMKHEKECS